MRVGKTRTVAHHATAWGLLDITQVWPAREIVEIEVDAVLESVYQISAIYISVLEHTPSRSRCPSCFEMG